MRRSGLVGFRAVAFGLRGSGGLGLGALGFGVLGLRVAGQGFRALRTLFVFKEIFLRLLLQQGLGLQGSGWQRACI